MAVKDRDCNSSSIFLSYGDVFEDEEDSIEKRSTRDKLHRCLNKLLVHTAIVVIVLIQVLIITFLLLIHFKVIQDPPASNSNGDLSWEVNTTSPGATVQQGSGVERKGGQDSGVRRAEDALNAVNIVVFSLFVVEILLRVAAKGSSIIVDKLQVFDGVVVFVVCLLYISLLAADTDRNVVYGLAYLIVLRLWRIGRVYHDITEGERRKSERVVNTHRKAAKDAEKYARSMIAKVEQLQHEISVLREQGKIPQENDTNSSPAMRSDSQHTYTPDDAGTSEDEFDHYEKNTKKVLEMVKVELSGGSGRTPNGSLPSGTPNGSVPNMTPTSSCSYLTGDGTEADKVSNKFPDLVEQAQGLEGQTQSNELQTNNNNSDSTVVNKSGNSDKSDTTTKTQKSSPKLNTSRITDKGLQDNSRNNTNEADNGNYAYNNMAFQSDSESQGQGHSKGEGQLQVPTETSKKSKYDEFGSTTYLNQDGIPMTDL